MWILAYDTLFRLLSLAIFRLFLTLVSTFWATLWLFLTLFRDFGDFVFSQNVKGTLGKQTENVFGLFFDSFLTLSG